MDTSAGEVRSPVRGAFLPMTLGDHGRPDAVGPLFGDQPGSYHLSILLKMVEILAYYFSMANQLITKWQRMINHGGKWFMTFRDG